jgi:LPXTG-site transpeptidase (sortase) family protein
MTERDQLEPLQRRISALTAAGALLILIGGTALSTYLAFIVPGKVAAQAGPPERFIIAATEQARREVTAPPPQAEAVGVTPTLTTQPTRQSIPTPTLVPTVTPGGIDFSATSVSQPDDPVFPEANDNEFGEWPLPEHVDVTYWISIPAIELEAPIIALSPRERTIDDHTVARLPVPNSYSVAWDARSTEPGFFGNTVLTGHHNAYGGVFQDLENLFIGAEIAVWSERGVFSYYVTQIEYIAEENQPLEVRMQNAQWLRPTADQRFTLITCWPRDASDHRLIVVAKP